MSTIRRRACPSLPGIILLAALPLCACGYRVRSSVGHLPSGLQSLAIPAFHNLSPQFRAEQKITAALLKEFSTRTRIRVVAEASGADAVLQGDIVSAIASPVTFGTDTFGSAFLITIQIGVKLVRRSDAAVIWENPAFLFRERYTLNSRVKDFFSEENPAVDRMARDFAASLASTILNP